MGFWERLTGIGIGAEPKIPVHAFSAALGEFERGLMTRADIITGYGIQPSEEADLDALTATVIATPEAYPMGGFVTLTNVGTAYDSTAAAKGLGFTAVDATGITQLVCRVRYNKVGSGTLSWQLWNETDGQELGVIDDAVVGDNKQNDITVIPAQPVTGGVKLLRVRVKSTTGADDPVYYGSCLFIRRVARLTADDLHGLFNMAESQIPPLNTVAALKARLGL